MLRVIGVMVAHLQDLIALHDHFLFVVEGLLDDFVAKSLFTLGLEAVAMYGVFALEGERHGLLSVVRSVRYASKLVSGGFLRARDKKHDIAARLVSLVLLRSKFVTVLIGPGHRAQKSLLVDKRKQVDTHPGEGGPVDIEAEVCGVEIYYLAIGLAEQMPVALGNGVGALFREDGHELFEGSERFAHDEVDLHFVAPDKIGSERSIVEWIVPVPALTSLVIVREDPLEAFNVRLSDSSLEC